MDFKNIRLYPELLIDLAILLVVAVALMLLAKCLGDLRESWRLKKEFAAHMQRREDEAREDP